MDKVKIVLDMLKLQQKLNDETNGEGWEKGYTKNNRIINWRRCIYMESAELIDSFNWKHWKDIDLEPDWNNIKIELVDIWHFVMSLGLEEYKNNTLGTINDLAQHINECKYFDEFCINSSKPIKEDSLTIVNSIERLIKNSIERKKFDDILEDFMLIAIQSGLNMNTLYKYYIGKNILNKFRQDNGYKEGTYKKIWNNKEDNEVMTELLEKEYSSPDKLYNKLEDIYKNIS